MPRVGDALPWLYLLEAQDSVIQFEDDWLKVGALCDKLYAYHLCEHVAIAFWGGPPDALDWYRGTLYTFLVDRIMYEMAKNGVMAAERKLRVHNCRINV